MDVTKKCPYTFDSHKEWDLESYYEAFRKEIKLMKEDNFWNISMLKAKETIFALCFYSFHKEDICCIKRKTDKTIDWRTFLPENGRTIGQS